MSHQPRGIKRAFRLQREDGRDVRAAVDEELRFHLDECVAELLELGWSEQEARAEATRRFGDLDYTREYCEALQKQRGREERRTMRFEEFVQDLKFAARTLKKAPGYAVLVVMTLALGIAATTTIFSVMNPYLFRPLPYANAERLVQINQHDRISGWDMARHSLAMADDWRARSRAFQDIGIYNYGVSNVTGPEGPEQIPVSRMSDNMLELLGVQPVMGRGFLPGEDGPGAEPVVLLDHGLWERRYGADPSIVGRAIPMDGVMHTVIGVMPKDFNFPFNEIKTWIPIPDDASTMEREEAYYILVGLLNEGWDATRAREELTGIQRELAAQYPDTDGRFNGVSVKSLRAALNFVWDIMRAAFAVLLSGVLFVLLIACVNVASLTLARSSTRFREVAVRAAMGAERSRIARQLLTESGLLAILGGAVGVILTYGIVTVIGPVFPEGLYRVGDISVDRNVLLFSLLVTLATPFAFGLWPALEASRRNLTDALKEGSRGLQGRGRARGRRVLVIAQVAMAVVLIAGAGLMIRSFQEVRKVDLGFDAAGTLAIQVSLPEADYPTREEAMAFVDRGIEALGSLPGVRGSSAVSTLPMNHESGALRFVTSEIASSVGEDWPVALPNSIAPGYLETMQISLVAGRGFTSADGPADPRVVLVNRELVERYLGGASPIGRTIQVGSPDEPRQVTIVGVVEGVRHNDTDLAPGPVGPQIYRPLAQSFSRRVFLTVATNGPPVELVPSARQAIQEIDSDLPLILRPVADVVAESHLQYQVGSVALTIFGVVALLLATLGIYGLISYSVAQRRREIGVRIAMGATGAEVRRFVLSDGLRLTGLGLAIGIALALLLGRLIASQLYGVAPHDPVTLSGVLALFGAVAVVASLVPAGRAARTNPLDVLRGD
jgi:putative ABC transport system permease protein